MGIKIKKQPTSRASSVSVEADSIDEDTDTLESPLNPPNPGQRFEGNEPSTEPSEGDPVQLASLGRSNSSSSTEPFDAGMKGDFGNQGNRLNVNEPGTGESDLPSNPSQGEVHAQVGPPTVLEEVVFDKQSEDRGLGLGAFYDGAMGLKRSIRNEQPENPFTLVSSSVSPEHAAQIQFLSRKLDIPVEIIKNDFQNAQKEWNHQRTAEVFKDTTVLQKKMTEDFNYFSMDFGRVGKLGVFEKGVIDVGKAMKFVGYFRKRAEIGNYMSQPGRTQEEFDAALNKIKNLERLMGQNKGTGTVFNVAEVFTNIAHKSPELLTGGFTGALAGVELSLILGNFPGLNFLPEEAVTLPAFGLTGFGLGIRGGDAYDTWKTQYGTTIAELVMNGTSMELAKPIAFNVATINAAVEFFGGKIFTKPLSKASKKYISDGIKTFLTSKKGKKLLKAINQTSQGITEEMEKNVLQSFFSELGKEMAVESDPQKPGSLLSPTQRLQQVLDKATDAVYKAFAEGVPQLILKKVMPKSSKGTSKTISPPLPRNSIKNNSPENALIEGTRVSTGNSPLRLPQRTEPNPNQPILTKRMLEDIHEAVKDVPPEGVARARVKQYIGEVVENHPEVFGSQTPKVFINRETFQQALETEGLDLKDLIQNVPDLASQLNSLNPGTDIELSIPDFATHLSQNKTLRENARFNKQDISFEEYVNLLQLPPEKKEIFVKELQSQGKQVTLANGVALGGDFKIRLAGMDNTELRREESLLSQAENIVVGGTKDAAINLLTLVTELGQDLRDLKIGNTTVQEWLDDWGIGGRMPIEMERMEASSNPGVQMARGLFSFALGFLVSRRIFAKGNAVLSKEFFSSGNVIAGIAADLLTVDRDQNLSNLFNEMAPELRNPLTDFLASKIDDSELEKALKNVVEGGAMGEAFELTGKGVKHLVEFIKEVKRSGFVEAVPEWLRSERGSIRMGPKAFVESPDGGIDFGEMKEMYTPSGRKVPAHKIRFQVGDNDFGRIHIEATPNRVEKILRDFPEYKNLTEFVYDITKNYTEALYQKSNGAVIIVKRNGKGKIAVLELIEEKETFYTVRSSFPESGNYIKNKVKKGKMEPLSENPPAGNSEISN